MFAESTLQKFLYGHSRGFNRGTFLVLGFGVLVGLAALYDTMLWGLDSPGYLPHATRVPASGVRQHLRQDPTYVVQAHSAPGDIAVLDLKHDIGEGLWSSSINTSLTGIVAPGSPALASSATYLPEEYAPSVPGPRIWLEDDGFSVGVDYWKGSVTTFNCDEEHQGLNSLTWSCQYELYEQTRTAAEYMEQLSAVPAIWWEAGSQMDWESIQTERGVNPWHVLGFGGGTVVLKEVFTVTKGTRRHTFLMSALKVTLLSFQDKPFDMNEIVDLVDRTMPGDRRNTVLNAVSRALQEDTGLTIGSQTADGLSLNSRVYELLRLVLVNNSTIFSVFHAIDVNVTLVHSETLQRAPEPFDSCDTWYRNEATGGKVRNSNCMLATRAPGKSSRFLGQVDTSTVFVLSDTLGHRRANTSASALNETAWTWLQANGEAIDNLVLSRGYILGGNQGAVTVEITTNKPAASIVQLVLVVLPFAFAAVAVVLVMVGATYHYRSSFLVNVVATTHVDGEMDCNKPGDMKEPPEVGLVVRGEHVLIATQTGVFWHGGGGDEADTHHSYNEGYGQAYEKQG